MTSISHKDLNNEEKLVLEDLKSRGEEHILRFRHGLVLYH
jgi:hypothetical protein